MTPKNRLRPFTLGITISSLALLFLASGCSKNFTSASDALIGQPAATSFWTDSSDATSAVNSIYGSLRTWGSTAFPAIAIESIGSDDAEKGSTANDATFFNQYNNFTVDATEGQGYGFWQALYQSINFCNQVLDHVDTLANVETSLRARYLAEAKFVRAYCYFRLVRAFGNIPLILKVPVTADELNPAQSTSTLVYAAIESDLTDAASVLPASYSGSDVGRATKGAALALHAKVSMYLKNWADVLSYSNSVINLGVYSLFSSYYQQFRLANENNSESVFEVQCAYEANNDDVNSSQYSQVQGDRDVSPSVGWGFNVPTQDLVDEFETGDSRKTATIMFAGTTTPSGDVVPAATAGAPTMYNMKSYVPFALAVLAGNQGCQQNVRALRYSDVLLMNAEANNELGNTSAALASLELVRARARANSDDPSADLPAVTTTDQTALRTAIYHERRVELAFENDRYFDVIRQGRGTAVFGALGWKANKNEVWPIPQTEIDNSGGKLIQNTGY